MNRQDPGQSITLEGRLRASCALNPSLWQDHAATGPEPMVGHRSCQTTYNFGPQVKRKVQSSYKLLPYGLPGIPLQSLPRRGALRVRQGHLGTKTGLGEALWAEGIPNEWLSLLSQLVKTSGHRMGPAGVGRLRSHRLTPSASRSETPGPGATEGLGAQAELAKPKAPDSARGHLTRFKNRALSSALNLLTDLSSLENSFDWD